MKIVAEKKYGELLGFHVYGHLATELLTEGTVALHLEARLTPWWRPT